MDTNGGRAGPCTGEQLIVAIQAAVADHPQARFEGTGLGQVVATVDGQYVGFIDVRYAGVNPDVDGAEFWDPAAGTPGRQTS